MPLKRKGWLCSFYIYFYFIFCSVKFPQKVSNITQVSKACQMHEQVCPRIPSVLWSDILIHFQLKFPYSLKHLVVPAIFDSHAMRWQRLIISSLFVSKSVNIISLISPFFSISLKLVLKHEGSSLFDPCFKDQKLKF